MEAPPASLLVAAVLLLDVVSCPAGALLSPKGVNNEVQALIGIKSLLKYPHAGGQDNFVTGLCKEVLLFEMLCREVIPFENKGQLKEAFNIRYKLKNIEETEAAEKLLQEKRLAGKGTCGIVLPEATKEKVVAVKEGDALALPFGVLTWWHNTPESGTELVVLFLGDTSKGHKPGQFTNFQLTGSSGIFTGFSTEFVGRAWDLKEDDAAKLVSTQPASGIVKLTAGQKLPEPIPEDRKDMALNCLEAKLDVDIPNGGRVVVLNTANLPLVKEVGLGADLVRIDAHSMCSPGFSCDSAYQVTYIVRGSGRVQVVGPDGKRVLETRSESGSLFIVPRFHVVSKIADASGMEWFSIITTPNPIFSHLAGKTSVWKAISPEVLEAAFNTTPEMEKLFRSKRLDSEIFFAPN